MKQGGTGLIPQTVLNMQSRLTWNFQSSCWITEVQRLSAVDLKVQADLKVTT